MGAVKQPEANSYQFDKLLSENNLTEAWSAVNVNSRQRCFVKIPATGSSLPLEKINTLLSKSFSYQSLLNSSRILKGLKKEWDNNRLFIEYTYLDSKIWQSLTPEMFWQYWPEIFVQIAVITDLIHYQQLVHLDLKLENFQVKLSQGAPYVILTDLDFLNKSGTTLEAKILGTPEHIAPEILNNDIITAQSDNYSLGQSLRLALRSGQKPEHEKLKAFIDSLTAENPIDRPYSILDGLLNYELIDSGVYKKAKKTVLSLILLGNFQRFKAQPLPEKNRLADFLQNECKVFGFHEELTYDLEQLFACSPLRAFRLFKNIVRETEIENFGDFWHLKFTDDFLEKIFLELDQLTARKKDPTLPNADASLKKYLYLRKRLKSGLPETSSKKQQTWKYLMELGDLALGLNRPLDAIVHYREALAIIDSGETVERINIIHQLVVQLILVGQQKEAEDLLHRGIAEAGALEADREELELLNQRAYLLSLEGHHTEAAAILQNIIDRANRPGLELELAKAYYNCFHIEYIKGAYGEAEALIKECLNVGKKAQDEAFLTTIYSGLSVLYSEIAEYDKALKMSHNVVKLIKGHSDKSYKLLFVYRNLVFLYTRLGSSKDSEYWLNLYLSASNNKFDQLAFLDYSIMRGWMEINCGRLQTARESLLKASGLFQTTENSRYVGKAFYNLAEIALYQGEFKECEKYCQKALEIFEKLQDQSICTEISLFRHLNIFYNESSAQPETGELLGILEKLIKHNCRYFAVSCFLHIAVNFDNDAVIPALKIIEPLKKQINESSAPLFKAARSLIEYQENILASGHKTIRLLKDAYQVLEGTGQKFFALLLCCEIGQYYQDNFQQKLSRKFYQQAQSLARHLHHQPFEKRLAEKLDTFLEKDYVHERVLKSMLGISNILRDIENYENALRKVVEFAVNETGAERGVLLLKTEGADELQTRAYINCDEDSLKDICDFSRSIVTRVARQVSPLVVSDALQDKRTKKYKSIAVHNIRSVIGMPIEDGDNFYGVLYLDHHTIPALFGDDDITYVTSLTNFLAVILNTLRRFKTVSVNKEQLENELLRQGVSEVFVTHNGNLKKMLEQLPQLAQSNASILILGETGTGKEIISRLIHNLSHRNRGPFVKMNCAAIAEDLIESELFGIDDGIATNVKARVGKFEAADTGTLFLDEIGEMPLNIQSKVLRVLEYNEFERVGSHRTNYTDARFIFATNKDLWKMACENRFSKDLYYRIYSLIIEIPPLRERPEDIEPLIEHFSKLNATDPKKRIRFSAAALTAMTVYPWPGNVRELKNLIDRFNILYPGKQIDLVNLPSYIRDSNHSSPLSKEHQVTLEKNRILKALHKHSWNKSAAARELQMPLSTLCRKIIKFKIKNS